jgi:hypothetical protein
MTCHPCLRNTPRKTGGESGRRVAGFSSGCVSLPLVANFFRFCQLAPIWFGQRFRPFAGFCRFFYFNDTRNDTRREDLGRRLRSLSSGLARTELMAHGRRLGWLPARDPNNADRVRFEMWEVPLTLFSAHVFPVDFHDVVRRRLLLPQVEDRLTILLRGLERHSART